MPPNVSERRQLLPDDLVAAIWTDASFLHVGTVEGLQNSRTPTPSTSPPPRPAGTIPRRPTMTGP